MDLYASEQEIAAALSHVQAALEEIERCDEASKLEATNGKTIQFEANNMFGQSSDHLGRLVIFQIEPIKEQEPSKGKDAQEKLLSSRSKIFILFLFYCTDLRICPSPSKTLTGHSGSIRQVLFLPSGSLASCSKDNSIRVWGISSGKELYQLTGHADEVCSLAMLPNGWLASGSDDHTIKLWDLGQKKEASTLRGHSNSVLSLQVLTNGHLVSYSTDDTLKIWHPYLKEKNLIRTIQGHGNSSWHLPLFGVLSSDLLVTYSRGLEGDEALKVFDPTDGKTIKSLSNGQKDALSMLILSNDQVVIGFEDGSIKIFDLESGATREIVRAHGSDVTSLSQLPDGSLVSSGFDSRKATIKVWNLADLRLLQRIQTGHKKSIPSIDVSKHQALLATGSPDTKIKIWPLVNSTNH